MPPPPAPFHPTQGRSQEARNSWESALQSKDRVIVQLEEALASKQRVVEQLMAANTALQESRLAEQAATAGARYHHHHHAADGGDAGPAMAALLQTQARLAAAEQDVARLRAERAASHLRAGPKASSSAAAATLDDTLLARDVSACPQEPPPSHRNHHRNDDRHQRSRGSNKQPQHHEHAAPSGTEVHALQRSLYRCEGRLQVTEAHLKKYKEAARILRVSCFL